MLEKLKGLFFRRPEEVKDQEKPEEGQPPESPQVGEPRPLTPEELEDFKRAMGITPHNYWTWAGKTKNFKLLTDGEYVWVEGFEDHVGKSLPLTEQRAWSWEFIRKRLEEFGS